MPFALLFVAGELCKTLGIIPAWTESDYAVAWAWDEFLRSSDGAALDADEQALANLREFVACQWDVGIRPLSGGDGGGAPREAVGWYDNNAVYLPPKTLRKAIGGAIKERAVGKLLYKRKLLARREKDRYTIRAVPGLHMVGAYALMRDSFGRSHSRQHATSWLIDE